MSADGGLARSRFLFPWAIAIIFFNEYLLVVANGIEPIILTMLFPNARNSLRRWSEHKNKIPAPVAVTLINLMAEQHTTIRTGKWFRPEHASSLLRPIRLQIVITLEIENGDDTEKELFSSRPSGLSTSVHPRWEHLDERMDFSPSDESYRSMKLRFLVDEDVSNDEEENSSGSSNNNNNTRRSPIVLLEVPAHPSLLQRLTEVPDSLPPNSCLIYFSDGSSRVTPVLFQALVDGKLTEHPPSSDLEDFSRFEDDVFRTLDGVTPQKARERITSVSRLLLSEEERQQQQTPPSQTLYSAIQDGSSTTNGSSRSSERKVNEKTNREQFSMPAGSVMRTNDLDATLDDLREEEKYLESMLTLEEALMEREVQALNKV
jgi:hypothetical protein